MNDCMATCSKLTRPLALVAVLLLCTGCGKGNTANPEQLARAAVDAVKAKDFAAYKRLCISKSEMLATMDAAIATGEVSDRDKEFIEQMKSEMDEKFPEFEAEIKQDFESMVEEIDWSKIEVKTVEIETKFDEGLNQARVTVHLSNDQELRINGVIESPSGWRIADDNPLRLRTPLGDSKKSDLDHMKDAMEKAKDKQKSIKDAAKDALKDLDNLKDLGEFKDSK